MDPSQIETAATPGSAGDDHGALHVEKHKTLPLQTSSPQEQGGTHDEEAQNDLRSKSRIYIIISALFVCLAVFPPLLTAPRTIVSPALPVISNHVHSGNGYTWVGSAYFLANAASGPIWGKLSDIWGRKPVLLAAVAVFFFSSLACAASPSIGGLIAGRAVQGAAAGGIVTLVNIAVSDLFGLRERTFYLSMTSVVWAFAAGVGPVLGGAFTQRLSWRWCWWINLPCSGAAFAALLVFMHIPGHGLPLLPGLKRVDWAGCIIIVAITVMTLLGLDFGGVIFPWSSPRVICLIVIGIALIGVFVWSEARFAPYPVMPMELFQDRSNVAILLVVFFHGFTYVSASYYLPIYFQAVGGSSPLQSGLLILPVAVLQSGIGTLTGMYMRRTGRYRELMSGGMALMTLGFGLFTLLPAHLSLAHNIPFELIAGLGIGPVFSSPIIALQARVHPDRLATATATLGFTRNLATCISVVVGGVVLQNGMKSREAVLSAALGKTLAQKLSGAAAGANVGIVKTLSAQQQVVIKTAYTQSLKNMWILYTVSAGLGFVASLFVLDKALSERRDEQSEAREVMGEGQGGAATGKGDDVELRDMEQAQASDKQDAKRVTV